MGYTVIIFILAHAHAELFIYTYVYILIVLILLYLQFNCFNSTEFLCKNACNSLNHHSFVHVIYFMHTNDLPNSPMSSMSWHLKIGPFLALLLLELLEWHSL